MQAAGLRHEEYPPYAVAAEFLGLRAVLPNRLPGRSAVAVAYSLVMQKGESSGRRLSPAYGLVSVRSHNDLSGIVQPGRGLGAGLMAGLGVRESLQKLAGFLVVPGTLNVRLPRLLSESAHAGATLLGRPRSQRTGRREPGRRATSLRL